MCIFLFIITTKPANAQRASKIITTSQRNKKQETYSLKHITSTKPANARRASDITVTTQRSKKTGNFFPKIYNKYNTSECSKSERINGTQIA